MPYLWGFQTRLVSYLYLILPRQQDFAARGLPSNLQNIYYIFRVMQIYIYSFIKNSTPDKHQDCEISHLALQNAKIKASHVFCTPIFFHEVQLSWILCLYFRTRKSGLFLKFFFISCTKNVYSGCTETQT